MLVLCHIQDDLAQPAASDPQSGATIRTITSDTLTVAKAGGGIEKLDVRIEDWRFPPADTAMSVPTPSPVIVGVVNGNVSVRTAGAFKAYNTGEYWTVPGSSTITVTVRPPVHGATLRTIVGAPDS